MSIQFSSMSNIPAGCGLFNSTADIAPVIRFLAMFGIDAKVSFIQNIIGELERSALVFLDYQCVYLSGK